MVELKTSRERIERKRERQRERDIIIVSRFEDYKSKGFSVSDAVKLTANDFDLSEPTVYNIRRRSSSV